MAFSFDFKGDDISPDDEGLMDIQEAQVKAESTKARLELFPPQLHTLEQMLATLPSSVSYSFSNGHTENHLSPALATPRRELFDIRAQLMAEADVSDSGDPLVEGLSADIKPRIYEGGFKTWECSIDLARYLEENLEHGSLQFHQQNVHVIELGAGTAVPTSTILSYILRKRFSESAKSQARLNTTITVADYNSQVLQLATVPNLLLAGIHSEYNNSLAQEGTSSSGELDTALLAVQSFTERLASQGVIVRPISGAWGHEFVQLARGQIEPSKSADENNLTLVLASETIYSPDSLPEFVRTLVGLLSADRADALHGSVALALVAAKKVYFGVGGGVDDFVDAATKAGASVQMVWDSDSENAKKRSGGVGRCILEVTVNSTAEAMSVN